MGQYSQVKKVNHKCYCHEFYKSQLFFLKRTHVCLIEITVLLRRESHSIAFSLTAFTTILFSLPFILLLKSSSSSKPVQIRKLNMLWKEKKEILRVTWLGATTTTCRVLTTKSSSPLHCTQHSFIFVSFLCRGVRKKICLKEILLWWGKNASTIQNKYRTSYLFKLS